MEQNKIKDVKEELRRNLNQLKLEHNLDWKAEIKILQMLAQDLADDFNSNASIVLEKRY